jgi:hypothetical protein
MIRIFYILVLFIFCLTSCQKEIIERKLDVSANPILGGKISPEISLIENGQSIDLLAIPNPEYLFKDWSGAGSGSQNPMKLIMDSDKIVVGNFVKKQYPLSVSVVGQGLVKEEVINLATNSIYLSGTLIKLSAQAVDKWYFSNWSGDTLSYEPVIQLFVKKPLQISANFFKNPFENKVKITGLGSFKESLLRSVGGNQLLYTAIADNNYIFDQWDGDLTSKDPVLVVPMDKSYALNLNFRRKVKVQLDTSLTVSFVQRNNSDKGILPLYFLANHSFESAKIKFKPIFGGKATDWIPLAKLDSLKFGAKIELSSGAYSANLVLNNGNAMVLDTLLNSFKVGEIFGVIGHSLAEGQDPYDLKNYDKTKSTVATWPWSNNVSFWGRLGELLATKLNVPVLIYNTGLGASNTVQWGLSSEGMYFEHGFYDWKKRYPYSIFEDSFFKYIPKSGVRAILVMHGENDQNNFEDEIVLNAQRYINFTRNKLNYQKLQFSICRCGNPSAFSWYQKVLNSQTRMVNEIPYTSWGGFVNDLQGDQYRWDGIHLNYAGLEEAAKKWNTALDANFFKNSLPYLVN